MQLSRVVASARGATAGALRAQTGGLSATFWWLWGGTLVNRLGNFVVPFLALYVTLGLGRSPEYAGLVLACAGAGSALGAISGGWLADRAGRRATLVGSLVAAAVAMLALGWVRGTVGVATLAGLVGATSNATRPAISAAVADVVAAADRVRAYGLNYWAANLGFMVAPVVSGLLAAVSWRALFVADAVTSLVAAAVLWVQVPETSPDRSTQAAEESAPAGMIDVLRDRTFLVLMALHVVWASLLLQFSATLPIAMATDGLGSAAYGAVMAFGGGAVVLLQLPVTRLVRDSPASAVLAGGTLVTGIGFGLTGLAHGPVAYAATVLVWSVGEIAYVSVVSAMVADLAPVALRGRYQGMYTLAWSAAAVIGPGVGGVVLGRLGGGWLWGGCAVLGVLAGLGQLAAAGSRQHRLAAVTA